jgi:chitinase
MRKLTAACAIVVAMLGCSAASAQITGTVKTPQLIDENYLARLGMKPKFERQNKLTADGNAATKQQRVRSVQTWMGSFTSNGQIFPYTMVGKDPTKGGEAHVETALISISFFFDEFADQNGSHIVIDAAPIIPQVLNSPEYQKSAYGTGFTQFSDAIQRAEFFSAMKNNWHTIIEQPRTLTPVQIVVPFGQSIVLQLQSTGEFLALINMDFFVSQLNTITQLEPARVDELEIALTRNALFYSGDPSICCVLGFHTAFETEVHGNTHSVQTFAMASWIDQGILANPEIADVLSLSHEITEWMNDPFVNNVVPAWQFPDGSGVCRNILETGDPVEVLPTISSPVVINGFLYHPQTEALLQWFTRESPSSAFQHAYSYPDTTALTTPSLPCATTP